MTGTLQLPDGRQVGYETYGAADGAPLVLLHGFSDSRLTGAVFAGAARRTETRLIVPDRPGTGLSTGLAGSFAGLAGWFAAFLDGLDLPRVPLAAVSGGGPFALGCACFAPERLERVLVISGLGPPDVGLAGMPLGQRFGIAVARRSPRLAAAALAAVAGLARRSPRAFLRLVAMESSDPDARAIERGGSLETVVRPFVEAYRQGPAGVREELRLLLRPWEFRPEDVAVPVRFEHGAEDATVPPAAARELSSRVPGSTLSVREGVGHFSLAPRHADELLELARSG